MQQATVCVYINDTNTPYFQSVSHQWSFDEQRVPSFRHVVLPGVSCTLPLSQWLLFISPSPTLQVNYQRRRPLPLQPLSATSKLHNLTVFTTPWVEDWHFTAASFCFSASPCFLAKILRWKQYMHRPEVNRTHTVMADAVWTLMSTASSSVNGQVPNKKHLVIQTWAGSVWLLCQCAICTSNQTMWTKVRDFCGEQLMFV